MVETHIDISSVAGETAIDKDSITSQDESIVVTNTDNGVDLSVVPTPLVTEEADGLERKEDKELRDHSYTNIAMKGTFKSVDDAIKALQNIDSQYKPRHGQAIQFTDTDGEVHIFRYFGYYDIERSGSGREWVSCAYDEINEKWCILKYTKVGDLTVATSKSEASLWTIKENILGSSERWFSLTSGDGKLVALTGNSSSEYAVSSDGGATWKLYSNIKTTYWKKVVYGMGKWWFLHETGLYTTTDFSTFENLSDRLSSITKLADMAVGQSCTYFLSSDKKLYSYDEETKTLSSGYSLSGGNKISQVVATDGADVLTISSSGGYVAGRTQVACVLKKTDSGWTTLRQTSSDTICGMMVSQDLSCVVEIHHTKLVLANLNSKQTTEIALPESVSNFSNFAVNGNELLVVNGQHVEGDSGSGNYAFLIDMLTGKILNSEWSEIPILSSNKNTLLASNDGEFANVALDGYLTYDEERKTLSTENSDRYEDYANNRLSDGNNSLFVTNDLDSIAIGDAVYSDEQCTTQVGTVENVHHNPNNPNDVVVKTNEDSVVYRFVGKQLDSLANSQAVANLWKKVKDYSSSSFYTKEETYTKEQVNEMVDVKITYKVVTELPETGESGIIYFCPPMARNSQNEYEEYMWIDNAFELIGTTEVDLSDYYTIEEVDNAIQAEADERKSEDAKLLPLAGGTMEGDLKVTTSGIITTPYSVDTLANARWVKLFTITEKSTGEKSFITFDFIGRRSDVRVCKVSMECVNTATSENNLVVAPFADLGGDNSEKNNPIFYFRVVDKTFEIWVWCQTWGKISVVNIATNLLAQQSHTVEWNGEVYTDKPENLIQAKYGIYARSAVEDGFGSRIDTTYLKIANAYNKSKIDEKLNAKANATDVYTKTESDNLLSSKADKSAVERNVLVITDDNKSTYIQKPTDDLKYGAEPYLFLDKEYDLVVFNTSENRTIYINGIRPTTELGDFSQGYIVTLVGGDSKGNNVRLSQAGQYQGRPYSFMEYMYVHHGGQQNVESGLGMFYQFMHYNGTWFSKSY